ncbi:hypothetical protein [Motilimonas pumila]|uniref:Sulfotransferase domain-containing protein n=1 Tax=Motilimonas pumila TaxID=2303987 RepID=A0A418YDX3_9GAMM|nr:hypothetical protein [Motilimonas pumila]RJG42708.1 hypothetical protein D1Z90_11490 [Motilimonas pumila]
MKSKRNTVVLVVGSGRSGTSAVMSTLSEIGCFISSNLIPAQYENQRGYFENVSVVNFNKKTISDINSDSSFLLPSQLESLQVSDYAVALRKVLAKEGFTDKKMTAIKDPRISTLFPIYRKALSSSDLKVVLAIRNPASVVESQRKVSMQKTIDIELVWLIRNVQVLTQTALDCFILHYEDLVSVNKDIHISALSKYIGGSHCLDKPVSSIDEKLNRAQFITQYECSPLVNYLYSLLILCKGMERKVHKKKLILLLSYIRKEFDNSYDGNLELFGERMEKVMNLEVDSSNEVNEIMNLDYSGISEEELNEKEKENKQLRYDLSEMLEKYQALLSENRELSASVDEYRAAVIKFKSNDVLVPPSPAKKCQNENVNSVISGEKNSSSKEKKSLPSTRKSEVRDKKILNCLYESIYIFFSREFDSTWYKNQYPDLKNYKLPVVYHYVCLGASEGREPNGNFNSKVFKKENTGLDFKLHTPLYYKLKF